MIFIIILVVVAVPAAVLAAWLYRRRRRRSAQEQYDMLEIGDMDAVVSQPVSSYRPLIDTESTKPGKPQRLQQL